MADALTGTPDMSGIVKAAYDRYVEFALRSQPMFRELVTKRPVQQAMPGSSVVFSLYNDLAANTTPLTEKVDPDAVAVSDVDQVTVTLAEHGNVVVQTRLLSETSFADVDPAVANLIAYNLADSIDKLVVATAITGTQVEYSGNASSTATVGGDDTLSGADIRKVVAKLRAANAVPKSGSLYAAYTHPETAHDLRAETGALAFEDIRKYTGPENILNGVTGVLGGAYFVETPRAYVATDGDTSAKNYRTIVCGDQAIAEAVAVEPNVVLGNVTDKLMRFRPIGWYALMGHAVYRDAALYRIESGSSIA